MLSVGRELNLNNKCVVCHKCSWEGVGAELSTGLTQLTPARIYFYVYRCPGCGSFDLTRKGKVLPFQLRRTIAQETEEHAMHWFPQTRVEDSKR